MVDNFVIGYDSQKQIKNAYKKHIDDAINMVKQDINARKTKTKFHFKLSAPFAFLIRSIAKNCGIRGIYVDANKCTKCGICTKVCPSGNITLQNQPTFANNCTNCLACVHHCPQKAVHCKGEKNTNRFINEHVTVQEIIKANSE
jgi:ferredoxin